MKLDEGILVVVIGVASLNRRVVVQPRRIKTRGKVVMANEVFITSGEGGF